MTHNRQIQLAELPKDKLGPEHFKLGQAAMPTPKDGELLLRVRFVQSGRAGVFMSGPMLIINFSVEQGLAGRPSSFAVGRVLAPFMR